MFGLKSVQIVCETTLIWEPLLRASLDNDVYLRLDLPDIGWRPLKSK